VAVPRILFAVPLVLLGIYAPAAGASLHHRPDGVVGMGHEGYSSTEIKIHTGQRITFQNDSRWIHIIGPGRDGHLATPGQEPVSGRLLLEQNQTYTTGTWNSAGTYYMTCSVHPDMTTKVIVSN
jgi:plastocyanin